MLTSSWSVGPSRLWGDLNFTETVNQNMQVPNRLKVTGGINNDDAKGISDSLPLSLYMSIPDRILLGDRSEGARFIWGNRLRSNPTYISSILAPASYLAFGNIKRRILLSPVIRSRKDQACGEDVPMGAEALLNPEEGSRERGLAVEGSLDDVSRMEIAAMKKQLHKISGRLQALEAQCTGWRQKEFLLYSALVSACVINTWLWMRR